MKLVSLHLTNFQSYDAMSVDFDEGLTLIIGDNGGGKSSVLEGVCWGLFGQTVRGADPWRSKGICSAVVEFETADGKRVLVTRTRKSLVRAALRTTLEIDGVDMTAQTTTETNGRIMLLVDRWERFVAQRVFTREQVARFGSSTDGERKELLEGALGLWRFDAALTACREKMRLAERAEGETAAVLRTMGDRVARAEETRAKVLGESGRSVPEIEAELRVVNTIVDELAAKGPATVALVSDLRALSTRLAREQAALTALEQRAAGLVRRLEGKRPEDKCSVCGRAFDPGALEAAQKHGEVELADARRELAEAAEKGRMLGPEVEEVRDDLAGADLAATELALRERKERGRAAALGIELEAAKGKAERLREAQAAVLLATGEVQQTQTLHTEKLRSVNVLRCVEATLGMKGARVALFDGALARIEAEANRVLGHLSGTLQVSLRSVVEIKQTSDKIERRAVRLEVTGGGGGVYAGTSAGERARIDVALLLGLGLAAGKSDGLVVFDEVFDALDKGGVEKAAEFLGGMERQRIVISHHPDVLALLPRARVLRAKRGEDGASVLT